jgi:N-hydroxyarylamine O-acetyltransferase
MLSSTANSADPFEWRTLTRTPARMMLSTAPNPSSLDLHAYLQRIGYGGDLKPSYAVLEAIHLAHATHIPFENLDILLKRSIRLDLEGLQTKLVKAKRGGYCFEHNLLLAAALEKLGFSVTRLAARVLYRTQRTLPRTHMLLLVSIEDAVWLADVGFGADGLLLPVPFRAGQEMRQFAWTYRLVEQAGLWMLQTQVEKSWLDLYAFSLEPQHLADYEMANYYLCTHPDSRFVQTLTAQRLAPTARHILRNRRLLVDSGDTVTSRILADDEEVLAVLAETFELPFPPGTRFRYHDTAL